jgi:hypothetical protein
MCDSEVMHTRQTIALLAVMAVLLVVAYGASLLTPPVSKDSTVDPEFAKALQKPFNLNPESDIVVRKHEGTFYLLDINPDVHEGGGFWALVKRTGPDIAILDAGNKSEYEMACSVLDLNAVPTGIQRFCTDGFDFIDRTTGATTTQEMIGSIDYPELESGSE